MGARILPPHALCDSLATSRNVGATRGASFLCCWQHAIQVAILRRSSCDGEGDCATCIFEESVAVIGRSDAPPNSGAREDTVEEGEGAVEDGDDASMDEGLAG